MASCLVICDMQNKYSYTMANGIFSQIWHTVATHNFDYVVLTRLLSGEKQDTLCSALAQIKVDKIIDRTTYNCITPELKEFIEEKGITEIYLAGNNIETSILITALEGENVGLQTNVIKDLCFSQQSQSTYLATVKFIDDNLDTEVIPAMKLSTTKRELTEFTSNF